jgi:hypothetical protein
MLLPAVEVPCLQLLTARQLQQHIIACQAGVMLLEGNSNSVAAANFDLLLLQIFSNALDGQQTDSRVLAPQGGCHFQ